MKKIFLLLSVVVLSYHSLSAQVANSIANTPSIDVSINLDTIVAPDIFHLSITLLDNKGVGKQGIDEVEKKILLPILKREGVNTNKDLSIAHVSSSYNNKGRDAMSKRYALVIRNEKIANSVISKLRKEDILVSVERTEVSRANEIRKELRVKALKEAKEEATRLLSSVGQSVGALLHVNVNVSSPMVGGYSPRMNIMNKSNADFSNLSYEKESIYVNINAKFEIK